MPGDSRLSANSGWSAVSGVGLGALAAGVFALSAWFGETPRQNSAIPLNNFLVGQMEGYLRMPAGSRPAAEYIRFYSIARPKTEDDLPFTTLVEPPQTPWGAQVVLGVFVQRGTGDLWGIKGPPRVIVVPDAKKLPSLVHGGCSVVNVVIDPRTAQTIGSWCNFDDRSLDQRAPALRAR